MFDDFQRICDLLYNENKKLKGKPMMTEKRTCQVIRPAHTYDGKQGFSYFEGISAQSVNAQGICMHMLTIPPGGRAKAPPA